MTVILKIEILIQTFQANLFWGFLKSCINIFSLFINLSNLDLIMALSNDKPLSLCKCHLKTNEKQILDSK